MKNNAVKKRKPVKKKKSIQPSAKKLKVNEPLTEGASLDQEQEFTETVSIENGKKVSRFTRSKALRHSATGLKAKA